MFDPSALPLRLGSGCVGSEELIPTFSTFLSAQFETDVTIATRLRVTARPL